MSSPIEGEIGGEITATCIQYVLITGIATAVSEAISGPASITAIPIIAAVLTFTVYKVWDLLKTAPAKEARLLTTLLAKIQKDLRNQQAQDMLAVAIVDLLVVVRKLLAELESSYGSPSSYRAVIVFLRPICRIMKYRLSEEAKTRFVSSIGQVKEILARRLNELQSEPLSQVREDQAEIDALIEVEGEGVPKTIEQAHSKETDEVRPMKARGVDPLTAGYYR